MHRLRRRRRRPALTLGRGADQPGHTVRRDGGAPAVDDDERLAHPRRWSRSASSARPLCRAPHPQLDHADRVRGGRCPRSSSTSWPTAVTALAFGDDTAKRAGRLTLNPVRHIDPIGTLVLPGVLALAGLGAFGYAKPVPINPGRMRSPRNDALVVSLAGPATNLALAACRSSCCGCPPAGTAQAVNFVVSNFGSWPPSA